MEKIWFTSDTHFNQQRTLEMSKRPFKDVKEMNNVLVSNWNKIIKPEDIVYHLGDFGDYRMREFLNGKIVLVKGNYERSGYKEEYEKYAHLFDEVHENIHTIILNHNNHNYFITMTHEPSKIRDIPIDEERINLFGHVHKLCMIKAYGINVGMDCHNFKPLSLEDVIFYHNALLNYYDDNVFY